MPRLNVPGAGFALALTLTIPLTCWAQTGSGSVEVERWEFTLDGRVGVPTGTLRVMDRPTPGTTLHLRDLGIDVSEALEGSGTFHLTAHDAVRATALYYFLRGSSTQDRSVFYNGEEFVPGSLTTNADFYRLSLDYERRLLSRPSGEQFIGTAGLTYVHVNPTLTGQGKRNSEDFGNIVYRQQIPVPILGLRWDHVLIPNMLLRTSLSGGGLPSVNSGRTEDKSGTLYLDQAHADLGIGIAYLVSPRVQVEAGYHFTYFRQHETSREDINLFELIDNAVRLGVTIRF